MRIYGALPSTVNVLAKTVPEVEGSSTVAILDESGKVIIEVDDYQFTRISGKVSERETENLKLDIKEVGDLSTLDLVPFEVPPPGEGEVQIEVYAAGLNFRDVLTCLGGLSDVEPEGLLQVASAVDGFAK
jgi:hypothetical protein